MTIIPNPSEDEVKIAIRGERGAIYTIEISNALGVSLERILVEMEGSETKLKKQMKDYPSGVYFVRVGMKITKFLKI
ncbi:MAG: T9SS type A sorting domain-containing protein [Candidatus Kapaibacteriota bacterium]